VARSNLTKFRPSAILAYQPNGGDTGGTLTVTDGGLSASIALLGQYVLAGFALATDGGTGSLLTYTPPTPSRPSAQLAATG